MCSSGEPGKQVGQQPGTRPIPWDCGAEQPGGLGQPGTGKALAPQHRHSVHHQRGQWQQVGGRPPWSFPAFSLKYSQCCLKNQVGDPSADALG